MFHDRISFSQNWERLWWSWFWRNTVKIKWDLVKSSGNLAKSSKISKWISQTLRGSNGKIIKSGEISQNLIDILLVFGWVFIRVGLFKCWKRETNTQPVGIRFKSRPPTTYHHSHRIRSVPVELLGWVSLSDFLDNPSSFFHFKLIFVRKKFGSKLELYYSSYDVVIENH